MLRERYPVAPYIHMYEMLSREDPFEYGAAGWDDNKIASLVHDAVILLQGMDKSSFCSFACSIDTGARNRLISEGLNIPEPVVICAEWSFKASFDWYFDNHPDKLARAYAFYDRGEPFLKVIRDIWLEKRTPVNELILRNGFWDLIENIQEVDMEGNPPIQAADMIAWALTRELSKKQRAWSHLAMVLVGDRGRSGIIPSTRLVLDEATLRKKHKRKS